MPIRGPCVVPLSLLGVVNHLVLPVERLKLELSHNGCLLAQVPA